MGTTVGGVAIISLPSETIATVQITSVIYQGKDVTNTHPES